MRRALALLAEGKWVRVALDNGRHPCAAVQLSKHRADVVPIGLDVLELLRARGYVAPGRGLPGGDWRFDLTPAGRARLGG